MVTMTKTPKAAILEVVSNQPDNATWDELQYHIQVREGIERGLRQVETGEHRDAEDVFDELLKKENWSESDHRHYDESVLAKLEHAHAQAEAGMLYDEEEVFAELLSDEDVA